jgi:hypothetical protein
MTMSGRIKRYYCRDTTSLGYAETPKTRAMRTIFIHDSDGRVFKYSAGKNKTAEIIQALLASKQRR